MFLPESVDADRLFGDPFFGQLMLGISAALADRELLPPGSRAEIADAYGVSHGGGFMQRVTFLIGPDGSIARVFPSVDPGVHADEVLEDPVVGDDGADHRQPVPRTLARRSAPRRSDGGSRGDRADRLRHHHRRGRHRRGNGHGVGRELFAAFRENVGLAEFGAGVVV